MVNSMNCQRKCQVCLIIGSLQTSDLRNVLIDSFAEISASPRLICMQMRHPVWDFPRSGHEFNIVTSIAMVTTATLDKNRPFCFNHASRSTESSEC